MFPVTFLTAASRGTVIYSGLFAALAESVARRGLLEIFILSCFSFQFLEKELNYDAIQVQFGEEIAKVVEFLTGETDLG